MNELAISLDANNKSPMYEQIYEYIKNEIKSGALQCGHKLPSTRSLSTHLDISRSTTQMAYDQLLSEGYIESVPCKGYFVCQLDGLYNIKSEHRSMFLTSCEHIITCTYDFSPAGVELNSFPYNAWRKITKNVLIDDNKELFNIGEPQGEPEFRETICEYLHQSRGVSCAPEQIVIGAGNEYLLMLINHLLDSNAIIGMENPTYQKAYKTFTSLSRPVVPISMDSNGLNIDELVNSSATVAYVTPSHQYPLGIVMPIKRRTELLNWANHSTNNYIIEDDYDSEFRYKGKPIPALQGNNGPTENVIYLGTFSKSIAPAIRMSYVVLPRKLLLIYQQKYKFLSCTVSRIDQTIVNTFIQEGYYERHLNKMRALYKNRHDILLNELKYFEKHFDISGEHAGIHILLTAKFETSEKELIYSAQKYGVKVYPLSAHFISCNTSTNKFIQNGESLPTVIIGYANISNVDIISGISQLKKAWKID